MVELMRSLGVESAPGEGAPFDPNVHEAIMREEDDSVEDGTVLQVCPGSGMLSYQRHSCPAVAAVCLGALPRPAPTVSCASLSSGLCCVGATAA